MTHARPRGGAFWIYGLPATGKSTLARALLDWLGERGLVTLWLDSDDLRATLAPAPDYSEAGRDRFYGALVHLARLGVAGGARVVISATAPRRHHRDALRDALDDDQLVEILLTCDPAHLRAERDIKGLYADSAAGRITQLPGIGAPFEASEPPGLTLDTTHRSANEVCTLAVRGIEARQPWLLRGEPR